MPFARATDVSRVAPGAAVDGARRRPQTLAIMSAMLPAILAERHRRLRLLVCATLAAILYLPALGRPALWEPDEGRYAEIAREMVLTHDYVTPRDNWVRYFEKPPLVYWAEALSIKLLGPNELAVRLPAALSSVAEVDRDRGAGRGDVRRGGGPGRRDGPGALSAGFRLRPLRDARSCARAFRYRRARRILGRGARAGL